MHDSKPRTHVTRRNFLRGIGLFSATAALAACSQAVDQAGEDATMARGTVATPLLAIIHTNDTHGHDVEVKSSDELEGNFSVAAVAALKADWEAKGYEVVLVDAGDATQGTPLVDTTLGAPAVAFMNSCGYELMAVGNHEFDWGWMRLSPTKSRHRSRTSRPISSRRIPMSWPSRQTRPSSLQTERRWASLASRRLVHPIPPPPNMWRTSRS